MLAFLSSEIHKPFIPLFFTEDGGERARMRQVLEPRFGWIGGRVEGPYLFGEGFTGADAMLYVMLRWAATVGLAWPHGLNDFIENVERRPSVRSALADEDLGRLIRPPKAQSSSRRIRSSSAVCTYPDRKHGDLLGRT